MLNLKQINFQQELYKLLDEDSDDEDGICQITGLPLNDTKVILDCNHHFNYDALYKEIYTQKFIHKSYDFNLLSKNAKDMIRKSGLDYFIKCPYCRNVQLNILPYNEELGLKKVYGINSLDKNLKPNRPLNNFANPSNEISYVYNGILFKIGDCCQKINNSFGDFCANAYVASIPNTELTYCKYHYASNLSKHKQAEKQAEKKAIKKKLADDKLAEKERILNERKKLFEEKNAERLKNGLPMLKRLPPMLKATSILNESKENVVEQPTQTIQVYVPEESFGITTCKSILKYGPNKGKFCGCTLIQGDGLCKRHSPKI